MLTLVALLLLLIAAVVIVRFFRTSIRVVPEQQRLVIERLGRVHRVAGPGPVLIVPKLERVAGTYLARDEPWECSVGGIFVYGVPIGVTIRLWSCFDLQRAVRDNRELLANLVKFSTPERREQLCAKVREALVHQLRELERRRPLPQTAGIAEKVLPLIPGAPQCDELLGLVKEELRRTLPSIGWVLNTDQPVMITGLNASKALLEAFERERVASIDKHRLAEFIKILRERLPAMPDTALGQLAAALYGLDSVTLRTLALPEGAGVRYEIEEESEKPRLVLTDRRRLKEPAPSGVPPQQTGSIGLDPTKQLTENDLSVLKRVPRAVRDQRPMS